MTETVSYARNVLRKIDDRLAAVEASILDGRAAEYDEYKKLVGTRHGLQQARSDVVDLLGEDSQRLKADNRT